MKTILAVTLAIFTVGGMFVSGTSSTQSIYISHIYIYESKLPSVSECGSEYDCEVALDKAWAEAMSWDKLLDERIYP